MGGLDSVVSNYFHAHCGIERKLLFCLGLLKAHIAAVAGSERYPLSEEVSIRHRLYV